jgi:CelD/BcsL family acetyltransferase involved in cellulose biosynthesis
MAGKMLWLLIARAILVQVGSPCPLRNVRLTMDRVVEINRIEQLADFRQDWEELLAQTAGASFFQSLEWLEAYWRHFGAEQRLRVLVVLGEDRPLGILPLVVRSEATKIGRLRVLTFPLHDWGSFYGPIGPDPGLTLAAGLAHIRATRRDWDLFELRWQGAPDTNLMQAPQAMRAAGFQAYPTVWDYAAMVDLAGTWQSYWSTRKGAWLRRLRHAEHKLAEQGVVSYERYRPLGQAQGDGSPRWDLYDACEELARRSWQGEATNGTTLSHEAVRGFLREAHEAAAACGAVDLNLLLLDGTPVAFVYGYQYRGYVYGLRRGYDAQRTREGAGNALLARVLQDSFARGDRIYDMGVGSLESKRHFQTGLAPVMRYSHFPVLALRSQALRVKRWWQGRRLPGSIAVGRVQDGTTDAR